LAAHGIPVVFFCEEADVQRACTPSEIIPKSADPGRCGRYRGADVAFSL